MSWLQIVLYVVASAPKLVSLIEQVISFVNGIPKDQQDTVKKSLASAIEVHKVSKDDDHIAKACFGIGCPPQPVK